MNRSASGGMALSCCDTRNQLGLVFQAAARRMGAVTEEIDGSHTAFIAQPVRVAGFIKKALAG